MTNPHASQLFPTDYVPGTVILRRSYRRRIWFCSHQPWTVTPTLKSWHRTVFRCIL